MHRACKEVGFLVVYDDGLFPAMLVMIGCNWAIWCGGKRGGRGFDIGAGWWMWIGGGMWWAIWDKWAYWSGLDWELRIDAGL